MLGRATPDWAFWAVPGARDGDLLLRAWERRDRHRDRPRLDRGQACHTDRTAGASASAWARPALAAAARRDTSSTLRPMARTAARSGRTSATRAPAAVSAAACLRGLAMKP